MQQLALKMGRVGKLAVNQGDGSGEADQERFRQRDEDAHAAGYSRADWVVRLGRVCADWVSTMGH